MYGLLTNKLTADLLELLGTVRNYQASNNLKKMKKGDLCFFYHSNIGKEIVGIVKVIKESFIDPTDKKKRFVAVQLRFYKRFKNPVTLLILNQIRPFLTFH